MRGGRLCPHFLFRNTYYECGSKGSYSLGCWGTWSAWTRAPGGPPRNHSWVALVKWHAHSLLEILIYNQQQHHLSMAWQPPSGPSCSLIIELQGPEGPAGVMVDLSSRAAIDVTVQDVAQAHVSLAIWAELLWQPSSRNKIIVVPFISQICLLLTSTTSVTLLPGCRLLRMVKGIFSSKFMFKDIYRLLC